MNEIDMSSPSMDWTPSRRGSSALQVHLLGATDLDAALQLQDRIVSEIAERDDRFGVLLMCEHPNGVTIGRDGSATDLLVERVELEARGVPIRWLRRGGATWGHHPGQIVAYLMLPIDRLGRSAPDHIQSLTSALLNVGHEQRVLVDESFSAPGLRGRCGELGFVGAAVTEGVTKFGACLNVSVPRTALNIVSWGASTRPSSLAAERMRPMTMASIRECWIRHLAAQCGYDRYHIWTGHPWLRRTTRRMYVCSET
ncbi:MAG: hypothetical protein B7Z55_00425 [Planctomycetales bacterium 12-60-4]|nr:MAG: hypothetical protein B7Z55_00425 [Planctomycetales bacterium 12-60-4]